MIFAVDLPVTFRLRKRRKKDLISFPIGVGTCSRGLGCDGIGHSDHEGDGITKAVNVSSIDADLLDAG